jgi:leucyl-tRNA synthetase
MNRDYEPAVLERKWQDRWLQSGIWKAYAQPGRPKFFLMFAYPGMSGYLHVGHMRGYTYSDVITRYKRMTGYNVLFPVGAHPTGNVAITFSRKIERGNAVTLDILKSNGCTDEDIEALKDPKQVVKFFSRVYINEYWKKFGFLADWDRFMTTIDPGYKKFIQWQFRKLHERGMLTQKPYFGTACLECGPVAVDASETDISQGGNAEKLEWTLLKFRMGDDFVMAATLRPETVFGQTNFWANPDVQYVRANVNGETWIISPQAAEKLSFQKDSIKIIGHVDGKDLIGKMVLAPVIDREIPILPSSFTDPDYGTGLVTSVPSDAPYDWMALQDLARDEETCRKYGLDPEMVKSIKPIPIIDSKGWGPNPGVEICEKMGISDQKDPKLEEATKEIYKAGFHTGRMRGNCAQFAGKPVIVAKEEVKAMMLEMGVADIMYDMSEPVICRCGGKVIVKQIPDQWFIDYGHPEVTEIAKSQVAGMNIQPQEYKENLPGILDWFKERACARLGNWMGTNFPFDERWKIEPISDSTLYSAYYLVSGMVNAGTLDPEKLDDSFFDCVFLGRGDPGEISKATGLSAEAISKARCDFGGKEHMSVHFPVFMLNHAAVLPQECLPRGIFVNWWFVMAGGKMSKSKGGAEPIPDAASTYTVDGLRLYYCHIASPHVDVEWDPASVNNSRKSVERIWYFAGELSELTGTEKKPIDEWLESRMHAHILNAGKSMEEIKLRDAANIIYFDMVNDLRWYMRRGGDNAALVKRAVDAWLPMMAPFTPHIAEELWETAGHRDLISMASYPKAEQFNSNTGAERSEDYVISVQSDISGILKMTGMKPAKICLYTAHAWKYAVQRKMLEEGKDMGAVMKEAMADEFLRQKSKDIGVYASKLMKEKKRSGESAPATLGQEKEHSALSAAREFFEREFNCEVHVFSADDASAYDPKNKSGVASPSKPAIYVE